jgi:hypothetical protein
MTRPRPWTAAELKSEQIVRRHSRSSPHTRSSASRRTYSRFAARTGMSSRSVLTASAHDSRRSRSTVPGGSAPRTRPTQSDSAAANCDRLASPWSPLSPASSAGEGVSPAGPGVGEGPVPCGGSKDVAACCDTMAEKNAWALISRSGTLS